MIAHFLLALATIVLDVDDDGPEWAHPAPVAPGRRRRPCEPHTERCRGATIYTCTPGGHWQRGPVCTSRRGRRVVCEVDPSGSAVCVESTATPFPGDTR